MKQIHVENDKERAEIIQQVLKSKRMVIITGLSLVLINFGSLMGHRCWNICCSWLTSISGSRRIIQYETIIVTVRIYRKGTGSVFPCCSEGIVICWKYIRITCLTFPLSGSYHKRYSLQNDCKPCQMFGIGNSYDLSLHASGS